MTLETEVAALAAASNELTEAINFKRSELDTAVATVATTVQAATQSTLNDLAAVTEGAGAAMIGFAQDGTGATSRTVLDKLREYISVKDFGAIGDGINHPLSERFGTLAAAQAVYPHATSLTNEIDWAAIQAAFNAAPEGWLIKFPNAVYRLNQTVLAKNKSLVIDAGLSKFVVTANVSPFLFDADGDISPLTADYTAGALSIQATGIPSAVKSGNFFKIVSNAVDPANRDQGSNASQYRCAEWGIVDNISGGVISIKTPLRFINGVSPVNVVGDESTVQAYTASMNARVVFSKEKVVSWQGGEILFEEGHDNDGWTSSAFVVRGYAFSTIDISISRGYGAGVNLIGCCMTTVKASVRNLADNLTNGQYGYGVVDSGGFGNRVLPGSYFSRVRHGFTTNALVVSEDSTSTHLLFGTGRTQNAEVIGAQVKDASSSAFDTHQCAHNVHFIGCKVDGAPGAGFGIRGRDVYVTDGECANVEYAIYAFTEYLSSPASTDHFTSDKDFTTTAVVKGMKSESRSYPVWAQNCSKLIVENLDAICSSSEKLINNVNSSVEFRGNNSIKCTSLYGLSVPDKAGITAVSTDDNDASLINHKVLTRVDYNAVLKLDLREAVSTTQDLSVIKTVNADSYFENDGLIDIKVSSVYSKLLDPYQGETFSGSGLLIWDISDADPNTIQTNLMGLSIRAESRDGTIRYDFTKPLDGAEILVSRTTPMLVHNGTGVTVQDVYIPPYRANKQIDSAGNYVRYEIAITKSGTGSAVVQSMIANQYHADYVFRTAGAANGYLIIEIFTLDDDSQYVLSRWQVGGPEVVDTANTLLKYTNEVADLKNQPNLLRFYANVASGSSVTFAVCRVYSNRVAVGIVD